MKRPAEEEILFQASRLFARKGFAGTSTREIAEASGLEQSSIFHYYPSKAHILVAVGERALLAPLFDLERISLQGGSAGSKLYRAIEVLTNHFSTETLDLRPILQVPLHVTLSDFPEFSRALTRYWSLLRDLIFEGITDGTFADRSPYLSTMTILSMVDASLGWYPTDGRRPSDNMAEYFAESALRLVMSDISLIDGVIAEARQAAAHGSTA